MTLDHQAVTALRLYLPISFIGAWRWSVWLVRRVAGLFYRPLRTPWPENKPRPRVSVVIPVYNEVPEIFQKAVESFARNNVFEVVAVIDRTDSRNIFYFETAAKKLGISTKLIVTSKPGKRPCLVDGILASRGEVIALVDSDTIWEDRVAELSIPYFLNPQIGAVTIRQKVYQPKCLSQVLFDLLLHTRYTEELPYMAATGHVVNTISGRTGIYRREALLNDSHDNMHLLTHEYYFKSRCISGDDKRLTHLIQQQGWLVGYQGLAVVYTPGADTMKTFLKQRLRWTRNSWRADTRAFYLGWIFRHPALALYNFDRFLQPFFMLFGLSVFIFSALSGEWKLAGIILAWWLITRFLRLTGYFIHHPQRIIYLPAYLIFSFWTAVVKLYALFTIVEQGWITRWHSSRLKKSRNLAHYQGFALTTLTFAAIFGLAVAWRGYVEHRVEVATVEAKTVLYYSAENIAPPADTTHLPKLPGNATNASTYKKYRVEKGDTLIDISQKLNVSVDVLRYTNLITNRNKIQEGDILYFP